MMLSSEFPINYFSVSEVEQDWPDEFQVRRSLLVDCHCQSRRLPAADYYLTHRSLIMWNLSFGAGYVQ